MSRTARYDIWISRLYCTGSGLHVVYGWHGLILWSHMAGYGVSIAAFPLPPSIWCTSTIELPTPAISNKHDTLAEIVAATHGVSRGSIARINQPVLWVLNIYNCHKIISHGLEHIYTIYSRRPISYFTRCLCQIINIRKSVQMGRWLSV